MSAARGVPTNYRRLFSASVAESQKLLTLLAIDVPPPGNRANAHVFIQRALANMMLYPCFPPKRGYLRLVLVCSCMLPHGSFFEVGRMDP